MNTTLGSLHNNIKQLGTLAHIMIIRCSSYSVGCGVLSIFLSLLSNTLIRKYGICIAINRLGPLLLSALIALWCVCLKPSMLPKGFLYMRCTFFGWLSALLWCYGLMVMLSYCCSGLTECRHSLLSLFKTFVVVMQTPLIIRMLETRLRCVPWLLMSKWTLRQLVRPIHSLIALVFSALIYGLEWLTLHYVSNFHTIIIGIFVIVYIVVSMLVSIIHIVLYNKS